MSSKKTPGLFEGFGIELEYMVVDSSSLDVLPVTDKIIYHMAGDYVSDFSDGDIEWSNELALHVIELKTNGPAPALEHLPELFHKSLLKINDILSSHKGRLMPGAMHPWMDPVNEMKLWPHEHSAVYEAYNRIFDCRGHGWANLQSTHINLPFSNEEEFGRLHAAIRLVLPLIPALAAASPVCEEKKQAHLDHRLEVYRKNQEKVPEIAGFVIPEKAFSYWDYERQIFDPLFKAISIYDTENILQEEWLNSRGAIARFDRNTIEIRITDIQECPLADLSIAAFITEIIRSMVKEKWSSYELQKTVCEKELHHVFMETVAQAGNAHITHPLFLNSFGLKEPCTAHSMIKHLFRETGMRKTRWNDSLQTILDKGTLSERILRKINGDYTRKNLHKVYSLMCECLQENRIF